MTLDLFGFVNSAVLGTVPVRLLLECLSMMCGVITFAYYAKLGCDPLEADKSGNTNQVLYALATPVVYLINQKLP